MRYDREHFFTAVRSTLFHGRMSQGQVNGCNSILDEWEAYAEANSDVGGLTTGGCAYALATPYHETGAEMVPVAEVGHGKGRDYGVPDPVTGLVYYGRGLPQLTWKANYQVQGARLGIDLEHKPDLMLEPRISANVLIAGMAHGMFTGKRLGQYFPVNSAHDDAINARRIINGLDRADTIAGYWMKFKAALRPQIGGVQV